MSIFVCFYGRNTLSGHKYRHVQLNKTIYLTLLLTKNQKSDEKIYS